MAPQLNYGRKRGGAKSGSNAWNTCPSCEACNWHSALRNHDHECWKCGGKVEFWVSPGRTDHNDKRSPEPPTLQDFVLAKLKEGEVDKAIAEDFIAKITPPSKRAVREQAQESHLETKVNKAARAVRNAETYLDQLVAKKGQDPH